MARFDASTAEVLVFTFKEGLLSAVAHDLKLRVGRFTIEEDGGRLTGTFDVASLQVVCAVKQGADDPAALSSANRAEIEKTIVHEVLDARRHPQVRYEASQVSAQRVEGQLTLRGVTRPLPGVRRDEGGRRVAEFELDQRDFGIKPYSAMLGALKLKPEVQVRVSLSV